jgi:hypothetical protein
MYQLGIDSFRRAAWKFRMIVVACALAAGPASSFPAYPLKASSDGRYLVDKNGAPFLMVGDSPHTLICNLTTSDAALYLSNRASNGINTLWVELLCTTYVSGRPNGSLIDGTTVPFTNTLAGGYYDLTSPNESYWSHVDLIVNMAATNGIQLLLDSLETGDWTSAALANGTNRCRQYGQYLGSRYKDFTNIIWITGNDFQTWRTPIDDAVVKAVALGILDRDTNHLQTVELDYSVSESLDDPNWWPVLGLNGVYTYYATYDETLLAYNKTNFIPTFLLEAAYEYEAYHGVGGTPNNLRRQEYWSLLSGALAGHIYGNRWTWTFDSEWMSHLNTPGMTHLGYFKSFFGNRPWYDLVPDQNHSTLTLGYGTYSGSSTLNEESDYATAARTDDAALAVIYTPTNHSLTIDLTRMAGPATARWFDPSSGIYYVVSGSPFADNGSKSFTPPGPNSDGDGDWVLVLETQLSETVPPVIAITAPPNGSAVSNLISVSANATDNVGVVAVQFLVDGSELGPEALSVPFMALWDTRSFSNGVHVVRAIARDLAGNRATNTVSVTTDNPPATFYLAAAYGFSEGTGSTTADASGNRNIGILDGPSWTSTGRYGNALAFGGTSWVTVNDSPSLDLTNAMTLEAWVYPTNATGAWTTILLKEAPADLVYMIQNDPANYPNFYIQTADGLHGVAALAPLPLNAWTHIAGTYDGVALRLFTNGLLASSRPLSGGVVTSTSPLRFGGNSVWGEYFQGNLDEIRIYNRALSQTEVQMTMNTPVRPTITLFAPRQTSGEIASNGFRFFVSATAPVSLMVERSSNFVNWDQIASLQYTNGQMLIGDSARPGAQFYRVRQP